MFNFSATLNLADLDFNYSMKEAISDGVIVDYKIHIVIVPSEEGVVERADMYIESVKGKKCLIYCNSIEMCITLSATIGCKYISGDMSKKER